MTSGPWEFIQRSWTASRVLPSGDRVARTFGIPVAEAEQLLGEFERKYIKGETMNPAQIQLDFSPSPEIPPVGKTRREGIKRHRRTKKEILADAVKFLESKKEASFFDVVHRLGKPVLRWVITISAVVASLRSGLYVYDWFVQGSNPVYALLVAIILPVVCLTFPQVVVILFQEKRKGRWPLSLVLGLCVAFAMFTSMVTSINGMYSDRSRVVAAENDRYADSEKATKDLARIQEDVTRYTADQAALKKDLEDIKAQEAQFSPKDWQYGYWVGKQSQKERDIAEVVSKLDNASKEQKAAQGRVIVNHVDRKSNFDFLHQVDGFTPEQNEFAQTTGLAALLELVPPVCGAIILIL